MTLTRADLLQFRGGGRTYRHWSGLIYTEGVKYLADKGQAYWLIDAIVSHQPKCLKDPMLRDIQFWKLTVKDHSAVLICERDTDDIYISQVIEYTDFPLESVKFYLSGGVLYLPSEH